MASAPLPPGWVEQVSRSTGKAYWFNTRTGESTYTRPAPPAPAAVAMPTTLPPGPPAPKRPRMEDAGSAPPSTASALLPVAAATVASPPPLPTAPADVAKAMAVSGAYNRLKDRGRAGRVHSSILHLKNFNNWVKATLVTQFCPRPCHRVLDLACGKLGDLNKWHLACVRRYCGVDISSTAVRDARVRFNNRVGGDGSVQAKLARADLGNVDLEGVGVLEAGEQFDAISIQFALHYLFATEARALTFFRNIAGRLAPGGVFIGTIPDADYLIRRLRDVMAGGTTAQPSFGNQHYQVTFTPDAVRRQYHLGDNPYGVEYIFYLAESVDRVAEYLVPWPLLQRLAASVGLVPLCNDNFHAFFQRFSPAPLHREALYNMKALNVGGSLTKEEWEVCGVYRVFAFQYVGVAEAGGAPAPPLSTLLPPDPTQPRLPLGAARYRSYLEESDLLDVIALQGGGVDTDPAHAEADDDDGGDVDDGEGQGGDGSRVDGPLPDSGGTTTTTATVPPPPTSFPMPPELESPVAPVFRAAVDAVCRALTTAAVRKGVKPTGPPPPPLPSAGMVALPPALLASIQHHGHFIFPAYDRAQRSMMMELVEEAQPRLTSFMRDDRCIIVHTGVADHKPADVVAAEALEEELVKEAARQQAAEAAQWAALAAQGTDGKGRGGARKPGALDAAGMAALLGEAVLVTPTLPVADKRSLAEIQQELTMRKKAAAAAATPSADGSGGAT